MPRLLQVRVFDEHLPFAGIERLQEVCPQGVIYNYREWGGPLIWHGHPDWKVTIDGRLYLYGRKEWERYEQIALGKVPVADVEEQYGPDAFFLHPSYHKRFVELLQKSSGWKGIHAGENSVVFVRRRGLVRVRG